MTAPPSNDPLHGITLETIVIELVEAFGREELGQRGRIRCFTSDPSVRSSLKSLRRGARWRGGVVGRGGAALRGH